MYMLATEPCTSARADSACKSWAISLTRTGGFEVYRNIKFWLPLIYAKLKKPDTGETCAHSSFF